MYQFVERSERADTFALAGKLAIVLSLVFIGLGFLYPAKLVNRMGDVTPVLLIGNLERVGAFSILFFSVGLLWRLENILRQSEGGLRWRVKYAVLGIFLIGGEFIWEMGYRLSYLKVIPFQFGFYALVLLTGIGFFMFAVIRHKLFEVDVYISRYIVYHSVAILAVGIYLTFLGIAVTVLKYTGFKYSELAWQSFIFFALLLLVVILLSQDVRNKVRFFINTHFFANKYDYRKEWVEYSQKLVNVRSESEVMTQLEKMIYETMFVDWVTVWVATGDGVYTRIVPHVDERTRVEVREKHPFFAYLAKTAFLLHTYRYGYIDDKGVAELDHEALVFLEQHNISLAVPLIASGNFMGFIGVGPEYTGAEFGGDDIDLLAAFACQTATALNMVRLSEELLQNQKLHLFNRLSVFLMHDLKNAASLLSLLSQNAPAHIHDPSFQEDLLETISSASTRLQKVMSRLKVLKPVEEYRQSNVEIMSVLKKRVDSFNRLYPNIKVEFDHPDLMQVNANSELVDNIVENLLTNARDALDGEGVVKIKVEKDQKQVRISIADNGPGIDPDFLKKDLFRPFKTTKTGGLGIGLWQAKNFIKALGGDIVVESEQEKGTTFTIILPLSNPSSGETTGPG